MSFDFQEENAHNKELQRHIDNKRYNGECLVAYLDILGFKDIVDRYFNAQNPKDENILVTITSAMGATKKSVNEFFSSGEFKNIELVKFKQFSDCVCMSMPDFYDTPDNEAVMVGMFILLLKSFNLNFINNNLYLRGGVSIGFHYEDNNIIFSDGLIKAFYLESKKAIYPRIILDEKITKRLKRLWKYDKDVLSNLGTENLILVDQKGITFINPFKPIQSMGKIMTNKFEKANLDNKFHRHIKQNLENNIAKHETDTDKRILNKYLWLKEVLIWTIDPEDSKLKLEYLLKP